MNKHHQPQLTQRISRATVLVLSLVSLVTLAGTSVRAADMLSDTELAALQEKVVDTRRDTTFEFTASTQRLTTPEARQAFKQTGKVQFILFCALNEVKERSGRVLSQRQNGTAEIRILDSEKKIVASASRPLEKMCTA